jgi:Uncharacterized low-complexity proteins
MNTRLTAYLDTLFLPYEGVKSVTELKADLHTDLQERYHELVAEGKDDETAFKTTIESIGDIEQTILEVANLSRSLQRQVKINLKAKDLQENDFANVTLHNGKFKVSALRGANFTNADLTGSTFATSDAADAVFDGANLTDCSLSISTLTNASFNRTILVRTHFNTSGLDDAQFKDVILTDVTITKTDLRKTHFEHCFFNGVNFNYCDLRGMSFDGMSFNGVMFDKSALNNVSFRGATLKNVSFRLPFSLTNKSYRDFKTVCFDGATMDKLTYSALKGMWVADLSKVTVV